MNLILLALFLAREGRAADESVAAEARRLCGAWTGGVTANLRAARRALKGAGHDGLRERVAGAELMAERILLARLDALADAAPAAASADGLAAANLAALIGAAAETAEGRVLSGIGSAPPAQPV